MESYKGGEKCLAPDKNMEANVSSACRVSEIMEIKGNDVHILSYLLLVLHYICRKLIETETIVNFLQAVALSVKMFKVCL